MDKATKALAEAVFRAGYSAPYSDAVDRAWFEIEGRAGYREGVIRGLLRDLGFDVVPVPELSPRMYGEGPGFVVGDDPPSDGLHCKADTGEVELLSLDSEIYWARLAVFFGGEQSR